MPPGVQNAFAAGARRFRAERLGPDDVAAAPPRALPRQSTLRGSSRGLTFSWNPDLEPVTAEDLHAQLVKPIAAV